MIPAQTDTDPIETIQRQMAELREMLSNAREDLFREREQHREDMELVGNALRDEAIRREWCDAAEDFVDDVNRRLNRSMPSMRRTYTVTVEVEVEARTESEAEEKVNDELGSTWPHSCTSTEERSLYS